MNSNPNGTLNDHLDIHGGWPFIGIHRVYDLRSPNAETKIGGSYGARAIIGIDASYELLIK